MDTPRTMSNYEHAVTVADAERCDLPHIEMQQAIGRPVDFTSPRALAFQAHMRGYHEGPPLPGVDCEDNRELVRLREENQMLREELAAIRARDQALMATLNVLMPQTARAL